MVPNPYVIVIELVVVFAACACSLMWAVPQARRLAVGGADCREIERLLGAVERACAEFIWRQAKLLGVALILVGSAISVPLALWRADGSRAAIAWGVGALCLGACAGVATAQVAHWVAARATANALAALRGGLSEASREVLRGAAAIALIADALSVLLTLAVFAGHYVVAAALVGDASLGASLIDATGSLPAVALGAASAAAVYHIGGSSFHTAAGVAGTSARSRYASISENDEQNPALVAELVGEYLGGVVSRTLDGFTALVLASCGCVLAATSVAHDNPSAIGIAALPLVIRGIGVFASTVALASIRFDHRAAPSLIFAAGAASHALITATGLLGATFWLLGADSYALYFGAGALGILAGAFSPGRLISSHHRQKETATDAVWLAPSQTSVARALGSGLQHTWSPLLVVGLCLGAAYFLGAHSGVERGGAFALVLAVASMLAGGAFHLSESLFSSMAEGVARIAALPRARFDLDARGRASELTSSGTSVGDLGHTQGILGGASAAVLVAVMLPWLLSQKSPGTGLGFAHPIVIVGGVLGAGSVLFHVGGMLKTSTRAASALDQNLRSRLDAALDAGMPEGASLPSYRISVQLAGAVASEGILPLALSALLLPFGLGVLVRAAYGASGAPVMAHGLMAFATIAALTGCSAALAAQGTLNALTSSKPPSGARRGSASDGGSATEFIGRCVQPAAAFGLKAAVVSSLATAPFLS